MNPVTRDFKQHYLLSSKKEKTSLNENASPLSKEAHHLSYIAHTSGLKDHHEMAARAHDEAASFHREMSSRDTLSPAFKHYHALTADYHRSVQRAHEASAVEMKDKDK